MPLYTYKCTDEKCEHTCEKIVKISNREDDQTCEKCNGVMKYEPFTSGDKGSNLYFRGNWFATMGKY